MTDEKISELFEKANGWSPKGWENTMTELRGFAEAIREDMALDGIHTCHDHCQRPACVAIRERLNTERSRVAELVEQMGIDGYGTLAIAAAIRSRSQHE